MEEIATRAMTDVLAVAFGAANVAGSGVFEAVAAVVDCAAICEIRERPSSLFLLPSFCRVPSNIQHLGAVSKTFVSVSRYRPRSHPLSSFSLLDSMPYRNEPTVPE